MRVCIPKGKEKNSSVSLDSSRCLDRMEEYLANHEQSLPSISATIDAITLFGHNRTSSHLARLFSAIGLRVHLIDLAENIDRASLPANVTVVDDRSDLPYLSSVLINCQNDFASIQNALNALPMNYRQRMAYIECSSFMRRNQLESLHGQMKFTYYLCMNLTELDTSTMIQPHIHLICSGDELVFDKLLVQTHTPAKLTFLRHGKTPFDSFYLCLFNRYSQAMHLIVYIELWAVLQAANPIYPGWFRFSNLTSTVTFALLGNLQFLFDWSYVKRPLMRQMILQSSSSSFTFNSIEEFQTLLECTLEHFFVGQEENPLKALTCKLHQFIANLDAKLKVKPVFELFTLY